MIVAAAAVIAISEWFAQHIRKRLNAYHKAFENVPTTRYWEVTQ